MNEESGWLMVRRNYNLHYSLGNKLWDIFEKIDAAKLPVI
jgi:hypothetical protein